MVKKIEEFVNCYSWKKRSAWKSVDKVMIRAEPEQMGL